MKDFKLKDKVVALDDRPGTVVGFEKPGTYWGDKGQTVVVKFEGDDDRSHYFAPYELRLAK